MKFQFSGGLTLPFMRGEPHALPIGHLFLSIHSCIWQIFIAHLLCDRHCTMVNKTDRVPAPGECSSLLWEMNYMQTFLPSHLTLRELHIMKRSEFFSWGNSVGKQEMIRKMKPSKAIHWSGCNFDFAKTVKALRILRWCITLHFIPCFQRWDSQYQNWD